jgi:hypothetical protein
MQYNALFDKGRRDAIQGAVANGDLSPMLKKQAEPLNRPNSLSVFIPSSPGVPMEEAIRRADEAGVVIASNKAIDSILASEGWVAIKDALPCWTGTMAGYIEPGRTFREAGEWSGALKSHAIVYVDIETKIRYLFPIPEEHLDKKDSILVVNHPHFRLETDGSDRIVRAAHVSLIERFPAQGGWYQADAQFGIPFGEPAPDVVGSQANELSRAKKLVSLVARGHIGWLFNGRRLVNLGYAPSAAVGVVVESNGG